MDSKSIFPCVLRTAGLWPSLEQACFLALQVLAAAEAEAADARAQCAMLARQADELQHRLSLAKQAKERAANDMARKEEEICALEVRCFPWLLSIVFKLLERAVLCLVVFRCTWGMGWEDRTGC